ncbi:MAG: hypothetical protein IPL53_14090 [Ignavibacteria bacterium]|nr:hypothetical protein [Ignavibacteria bacterium]
MKDLKRNKRFTPKNFYQSGAIRPQRFKLDSKLFSKFYSKKERRSQMSGISLKNNPKQSIASLVLLALLSFSVLTAGCGDSILTGYQNTNSGVTAAGENKPVKDYDSTCIQLDLNIRFKSEKIAFSKLLESNTGNNFNQIVSFFRDLKPGEILNVQELGTYGIFGLYINSTGIFTLYNSDGMAFRSKTVLMEKCSFIDLKLRNDEQKIITVTGVVAGE